MLRAFPHLLAVGFDNPYLIQKSLEALAGPAGLLFAAVGVFLTFGVVASKRLYWWTISLLLFLSSMVSHQDQGSAYRYSGFLQTLAEQGRNLVLALLVVLLLPSLMATRGIRLRFIHSGMLAYFIFEILYTFEVAASRAEGSVLRLAVGLSLFILTLATLSFGLSKMLQKRTDLTDVMKAIAWAGFIFSCVTTFELFTNSRAITINGRLVGVCGSATFAAELLVAVMLPTLYLILNTDLRRASRIFWTILLSIEGVMLIGTGTRTGLVMLGVGLILQLRARIAKIFPLALGLAIAVGLILMVLPEDLGIIGADRIFSVSDTRSAVWQNGFNTFLSSPFFGISIRGETLMVENSYISALGMTGLVGILPLIVAMALFALSMFELLRRRAWVSPADRLLIDMIVGGMCAELVGGLFDAYMIATVSIQVYVFVIYTSLLQYALERIEPGRVENLSPTGLPASPLTYDQAYFL